MPDYCQFHGETELIYPDFRDVASGKTLVAIPGEAYRIEPGMPGDGRWNMIPEVSVLPQPVKTAAVRRKTAETEPAAEPEKGTGA